MPFIFMTFRSVHYQNPRLLCKELFHFWSWEFPNLSYLTPSFRNCSKLKLLLLPEKEKKKKEEGNTQVFRVSQICLPHPRSLSPCSILPSLYSHYLCRSDMADYWRFSDRAPPISAPPKRPRAEHGTHLQTKNWLRFFAFACHSDLLLEKNCIPSINFDLHRKPFGFIISFPVFNLWLSLETSIVSLLSLSKTTGSCFSFFKCAKTQTFISLFQRRSSHFPWCLWTASEDGLF